MAPRNKRKALYELFDNGYPGSQTVPQTALRRQHMVPPESPQPPSAAHTAASTTPLPEPKIAPRPRPSHDEGGFPLAPGKSVRIPSGYLFFGGGLLLAIIVAAFAIGYARGERTAESQLAAQLRQGEGAGIVEPLNTPAPTPPQGSAANAGTSGSPRSGDQATPRSNRPNLPPPTRSPGGALIVGPNQLDPRKPGENYLFVALRGPEEALEIAEFLTASGVPAAIYEANRPTLRQVVALEGFASDAIRSQNNEYLRYRQNIRDLGREWATRNRNSQNFDDVYPARYNP